MKRVAALVLAVWMLAMSAPSAAALTGLYRADGITQAGDRYTCAVEIIEPLKDVPAIEWECLGAVSSGAALVDGDWLSGAFLTIGPDDSQLIGLFHYKRKGSGFEGKWTVPGVKGVGTEVLTLDPKAREKMQELRKQQKRHVPDASERRV